MLPWPPHQPDTDSTEARVPQSSHRHSGSPYRAYPKWQDIPHFLVLSIPTVRSPCKWQAIIFLNIFKQVFLLSNWLFHIPKEPPVRLRFVIVEKPAYMDDVTFNKQPVSHRYPPSGVGGCGWRPGPFETVLPLQFACQRQHYCYLYPERQTKSRVTDMSLDNDWKLKTRP